MEKYLHLFFITIFSFAISPTFAGETKFDCTIKNVYSLDDDASLRKSGFQSAFEGNEFSVNKHNGEIVGETLTTMLANSTRVINIDSSENSFKVIAEFDGQFQIIEIQDFKQGKLKPFVASSMGGAGIVTGFCN